MQPAIAPWVIRDSLWTCGAIMGMCDPMATVFTVGHSTRSLDELVAVLRAHRIVTLVDIRSFPASRRLPHFNRAALAQALPEAGITYVWEQALGGRRKKIRADSPHVDLRNGSFRNYADYMLTPAFEQAIERLLALALQGNTAIMCAERLYFRCHRMLVSDYLVAGGHRVMHIVGGERPRTHELMAAARVVEGHVVYDAQSLFRSERPLQ